MYTKDVYHGEWKQVMQWPRVDPGAVSKWVSV